MWTMLRLNRRFGLRRIIFAVFIALVFLLKFTPTLNNIWNWTGSTSSHGAVVSDAVSKGQILTFLSLSYHAAPIYDLMDLLQPRGVRFIERGINTYGCRYFNTCREHGPPLKVVDGRSVHQHIGYGDVEEFYSVYRDDAEFRSVDAFVCMHAAATCELFVPFNKPIIIITTIRYDNGRVAIRDWNRWNERILEIASDPTNVVAANNHYDAEYMRPRRRQEATKPYSKEQTLYYTGIKPILIPSCCRYTRVTYNPTRHGFLLGIRRDSSFERFFVDQLLAACVQMNVTVDLHPVRQLYPTYEWRDLAAHRGIVPLPCQPSMMALFEQYRMNIPMFLPAQSLLVEWHTSNHPMLNEMFSHFPGVVLPSALQAEDEQLVVPDPNLRNSSVSLTYWLQLCDWYTDLMPHVVLYESMYHLVQLLNRTMNDDTLMQISRQMATDSRHIEDQLSNQWTQILDAISAATKSRNFKANMLVAI